MEGLLPFWQSPDTVPRLSHTVSLSQPPPLPSLPPLSPFVSLFDGQIKRTNWENGWAIEREMDRPRIETFSSRRRMARENAEFVKLV